MSHLNLVAYDSADEKTRGIYDSLKGQIGRVPNLYAAIGNSANTLEAYLAYAKKLAGGSLSAREIEAVNLAVSEANSCNYCLAAHTALGKMAGFSPDEILGFRAGESSDRRLRALTRLSREITLTRGKPGQEQLQEFFEVGYTAAALVDLVALITAKQFANYINEIAGTAIDFPIAPELPAALKAA